MGSVFAIAKYTILEQIRNRLYLIIIFFGGALMAASLMLAALAPGHKARLVFDLGLIALEVFGLATAIFGAVTLILQEVESKTIYLLLTRPVNRSSYILGRFLGLLTAVFLAMATMAVLHILVLHLDPRAFMLFTREWSFWSVYPSLILMSFCKIFLISSVAIFFSVFATSSVSALVFTSCFWVAGHFGAEMTFLLEKSKAGAMVSIIKVLTYALPNFQYLNFRESYAIPGFPGSVFLGWAILYTLGYAGVFLTLSALLFSKKEF